MKQKFSTHWISSTKSRKQKKYLANAPHHIRHKFLSANLSKSLRQKYDRRTFPVRKGDEVIVMRGSFRKKKAKIASIDIRNVRVTLENIQRTKKDGAKTKVHFAPSVLQIQTLNIDDKDRLKSLNRKTNQSLKNKTAENKNASDKS